MSKKNGSEIFAQVSKSTNSWDIAISDAEQMIETAKEQIAGLRQAVRTFKRLRDAGMPFPGESPKQSEEAA